MGIRTTCPNGHKLNVKAFLAGLRGICPHCGASFTIPTESTRPSSKARNGDSLEPQARTTDLADAEAEIEISAGEPQPHAAFNQPASLSPVKRPPPLPAGAAVESYAPGGVAPAHVASEPAARQSPGSSDKSSPLAAAAPTVRESFGATPAQRTPSTPLGPSAAHPSAFPATVSTTVAEPEPPASPAPAPQTPDPLSEAPNAVWYVRPASGGQFGPATNEIMRAWLKEGRIGPDSLVWREGWRDWKEASATFPQFSTDPGNLAGILASTEPVPLHPATSHHSPTRRRMDGAGILLVCVLFVVVIVLVAVLCWFLMRESGGGAPVSTVGTPSRAVAASDGPARPWNERVL